MTAQDLGLAKILDLPYDSALTIQRLKEWIEDKTNLAASAQRLVFQGHELRDDYTLGDYPIFDDDSDADDEDHPLLHVVLRIEYQRHLQLLRQALAEDLDRVESEY